MERTPTPASQSLKTEPLTPRADSLAHVVNQPKTTIANPFPVLTAQTSTMSLLSNGSLACQPCWSFWSSAALLIRSPRNHRGWEGGINPTESCTDGWSEGLTSKCAKCSQTPRASRALRPPAFSFSASLRKVIMGILTHWKELPAPSTHACTSVAKHMCERRRDKDRMPFLTNSSSATN